VTGRSGIKTRFLVVALLLPPLFSGSSGMEIVLRPDRVGVKAGACSGMSGRLKVLLGVR
jgi:hypothetical protein